MLLTGTSTTAAQAESVMYADTAAGRMEAAPGLVGACPSCGGPVRPKCGHVVVRHWAHHARDDCDPWSEPMTEWHWRWQQVVPPDRREVVMGPHRADIVTASGGVVEVQHSAISAEVIAAREAFYGERMAWIFDATDAFTCGRITVEQREAEWDAVTWLNPRRSVEMCKRPVLLDLGNGTVLLLKRRPDLRAQHGDVVDGWPSTDLRWCRLITRDSVESWLADGRHWEMRRAAAQTRRGSRNRYMPRRLAPPPEGVADYDAYLRMIRRAVGRGD